MLVADALNGGACSLYVKGTGGPNGDSSDVHACLFAVTLRRSNDVTGLEAFGFFLWQEVASGKSVLVEACPLIRASAGGFNSQQGHVPSLQSWSVASACRIQGVGFGDGETSPVELCLAACAHFDRQLGLQKFGQNFCARGVDRRGWLKWDLKLGFDVVEAFGILRKKGID